jgi:hypothetical protein
MIDPDHTYDFKKAYCKAYVISEEHFEQDLYARSLKCNPIARHAFKWLLLLLKLQTFTLIQFVYLGSSKTKFQLELQLKEIKTRSLSNAHWLLRLLKLYPSNRNIKRIVIYLEKNNFLPWNTVSQAKTEHATVQFLHVN